MSTIEEYTRGVRDMLGIVHRDCHLYQGIEGARRIAREYGAGLADYPEEHARA
jgi:tetrahydromethanopterin S-methyltransferase subunit F